MPYSPAIALGGAHPQTTSNAARPNRVVVVNSVVDIMIAGGQITGSRHVVDPPLQTCRWHLTARPGLNTVTLVAAHRESMAVWHEAGQAIDSRNHHQSVRL